MPWLRNLPSLKPSTPPPPNYENLTVNHLMLPGQTSWNHTLVHSLFNSGDAAAILSVPLFNRQSEDIRIWKETNDGSYTVKSAYRICTDLLHETTPPQNHTQWQLLWRLHVPPRVRAFLWCAAHHCLPTRDNLSKRGVPCSETCVSCDLLAESHMHLFFVCHKAIACWNHIGICSTLILSKKISKITKICFNLFNFIAFHQLIISSEKILKKNKKRFALSRKI